MSITTLQSKRQCLQPNISTISRPVGLYDIENQFGSLDVTVVATLVACTVVESQNRNTTIVHCYPAVGLGL